MDTRPINGTLYVESFNPTGNPGEYTFENAVFNNQWDASGMGAAVIQVGFLIHVAATDFNTGVVIPGALHRYKLTAVDLVDYNTINATMVWDELGSEGLEIPTNGTTAGLSQPSPNYGYAYAPSEGVYPDLPAGFAVQTVQTDLSNITDLVTGGEGPGPGPSGTYKTTVGDATNLTFTINHSLGTLDIDVKVFDLNTGGDVIPGVVRMGPNSVRLDFTYPIEAASHRVIVRS